MNSWRVRLNPERCIGCGLCEETMPDVFAMGDYVAYVRTVTVGGSLYPELEVAAQDCPVNAISLLAESGDPTNNHDEKRENKKQDGKIRENDGENGNIAQLHRVKANDAKGLKSGEYDFSVVRDGPHHDQHPRRVPGF